MTESNTVQVAQKRSASDYFHEFSRLSIGDYVIHERHGMALYNGLMGFTVSGISHDFVVLIFKNNDKLYVPVENISLISRYGETSAEVALDSLKSCNWSNRQEKIRKKLLLIANNLLKFEAERKLQKIDPMAIDQKAYKKFSDAFGYTETNDQKIAISDVLSDMQCSVPMDRLICGDVGFGKTEVALRASFVASANGKQVVLLAPTTILVSQHFQTFTKRFSEFGIKVCQLSRFLSKSEITRNIEQIKINEIKIIIGTHVLLSSKIKFADLGLVIIDEEHHFGVKQKEKLRTFSKTHFLSLSATPIPRTLQLSMTGIRDLSLIATPPIRRLPIKTIVCEFDEADIKPAVEFEIKRNGQIFFVVPRIEFLDQVFQFLCKLFPKFRIDQIHGQSPDLEDTVINFYEHEIDILISTNIVDSGIDIPNVNTIFLYRFDLFGIAQLHQLRGRVGRSGLQAFAYFLVPSEREMSQNAQKKLELMQTFDNLGSGFSLANQDMDIRGAGNLLGEEQSGYIKEVGFELYQSMLNEAILMVKAGRDVPFEKLSPQVNLGVSALIPERYISDQDLRLSLYRRMGRLRDDQEIEFFHSEITEKYGTTPIELKNLLVLISTQINCKTLNVNKLEVIATGFVFTFHNNYCKTPEKLLDFLNSNELKEDGWIAKIRNDHAICMIKKWKTLDDRTKNIHSFISHLRLFLESQ